MLAVALFLRRSTADLKTTIIFWYERGVEEEYILVSNNVWLLPQWWDKIANPHITPQLWLL